MGVQIGTSPIVHGYIDWSITVPLQMIEFYLILSAVQPNLSLGIFRRLLVGTVVMLAFGYMGEAHMVNPMMGFVVGMAGWGFILFEIFAGEAGFQHYEIDCHRRLVHLPSGLLLRLPDGRCE